jgi:hypothetical protein
MNVFLPHDPGVGLWHNRSMTTSRVVSVLGYCLALSIQLRADASAGLPAAYLRAGWGAQAGAMGSAYVAAAEGTDAVYWNAAALALSRRPALASGYDWLSLGRSFDTAGLVLAWDQTTDPTPDGEFPMPQNRGWGTWALGCMTYSLGDDFEGRTTDTSNYYAFGDRQIAYWLSHGRALTPWWSIGVSAKLYQHFLDSYYAQGWGFDLSTLLLIGPRARLAVAASDMAATLGWSTGTQEQIPTVLRAGLWGELWQDRLFMAGQVQDVQDGATDGSIGLEFRLLKIMQFQAGIQSQGITFGGGVKVKVGQTIMRLDYAYLPDPLEQGPDQRLEVNVSF